MRSKDGTFRTNALNLVLIITAGITNCGSTFDIRKEVKGLLSAFVKRLTTFRNPDRLASQHELARAYEANGQVKEALSLLEQVVKIEEQILAEDHPSRLASQHELATIYWDLGHHSNAVQMMKHVVGIRSQVLDEQQPGRKNSEAWLEYCKDELRKPEPT
ncbi:hypothetical protein GJ744_001011 [Endocarpon pusillum]|uniref:Kinesin light chain n=1 Tax=Endocarpon pusillum TaxID=364733 RepID=A0A8H7AA33_9EURO|nr:hypothetical protein GJ744_001011 [Endocarpon pusillum]